MSCVCEEKNRALLDLMWEDQLLAGDWIGASFNFPADHFHPWVQVYFHRPCKRLLRFVAPDQLVVLFCRFKHLEFQDSTELRNFYIENQKPSWFHHRRLRPPDQNLQEAAETLLEMEQNPLASLDRIRTKLDQLRQKRAQLEEEESNFLNLEARAVTALQVLKRIKKEEDDARKELQEIKDVLGG